ncbi:sterol-binding-like protein [Westerdykella ornata]|uniref:Sterol-binding-like protein n=1 Tax=Westerdykella ornata TaxID=318751 RepID=A0A6A6JJY0_WESOR|nr:sterol-binding-like protein [Westerdykella ornata]KAF2276950.1 sterol-binding-like protein [Westerdykella ornata]
MSLKHADFPSSTAFDAISTSLTSNPSSLQPLLKSANAIFAFELKNPAGNVEHWYIDLKETGKVGRGQTAPEGKKPTVTLVLSDKDFGELVQGKANAQKLFMAGRLKVRGDVMKATKLEPVLKKAQTQAKL